MSKFREGLDKLSKAIQDMTKFDDTEVQLGVKEKVLIKQFKPVEQISVEILLKAEEPDFHGHWYSKETVRGAYEDYNTVSAESKIPMNLFHVKDVPADKIDMVDHWIVEEDAVIGDVLVKSGTWVASIKWNDPELWEMRSVPKEDGTYRIAGLSPKFWGQVNPPKNKNTES